MAYSYSPIGKSEVRLFKAWLGSDGSIHGRLAKFSVGTGSQYLPDYQAVSYAWGTGQTTHHANIDGLALPLLDSVHAFLLQMFSEHQDTWWWIDSICINQKDERERGAQITLMRDIFADANLTRVWLGEEADDSRLAIKFLLWMSTQPYSVRTKTSVKDALVAAGGDYDLKWSATNKLLRRSWWTRVWTVQEFTVARHLHLHCGSSSISRNDLQLSLSAIYDCGMYLDTTAQWNRSRVYDYYSVFNDEGALDIGMSLTATLAYLGDHFASDPRDRVYSLSGLVKDFDLAGHPDYEQSVEILYMKLVKAFIGKYRNLDIICLATVFDRSWLSQPKTLPSWVPDWRTHVTPLVVPAMVSQTIGDAIGNFRPEISAACTAAYRAASHSMPEAFLSDDFTELHCCGFILDTIDGLAGSPGTTWTGSIHPAYAVVPSTSSQHENHASERVFADPAALLSALMRCLTLDRQDHYLSDYLTPRYDYLSQFQKLLLLVEATSDDGHDWQAFKDWYSTNAEFSVMGWTLKALKEQIPSEAIHAYLPERNRRKSFFSRFHDTTVKMSRRLVSLQSGGVGTAPRRARNGDRIVILFGCSVPVVLRETNESDTFAFVGECYVDGFMEGEAMDTPAAETQRMFRLI